MFSFGEFISGVIVVFVMGTIIGIGAKSGVTESVVEETCQGTPWVIEEPLIKKTLTCEVVVKEKK